jgi:hypothetical protein
MYHHHFIDFVPRRNVIMHRGSTRASLKVVKLQVSENVTELLLYLKEESEGVEEGVFWDSHWGRLIDCGE